MPKDDLIHPTRTVRSATLATQREMDKVVRTGDGSIQRDETAVSRVRGTYICPAPDAVIPGGRGRLKGRRAEPAPGALEFEVTMPPLIPTAPLATAAAQAHRAAAPSPRRRRPLLARPHGRAAHPGSGLKDLAETLVVGTGEIINVLIKNASSPRSTS